MIEVQGDLDGGMHSETCSPAGRLSIIADLPID
jgi:hypothetical protein